MKTPHFWYSTSPGLCAALLSPLEALYARTADAHRHSKEPHTVALPVICLGNLVAGGSGKTPTAIALLKLLQDTKTLLSPGFLTRGYKGKISTAERVDESHDPVMWGDEALLLHRHAPTFVSADRRKGAALMLEHGCDAIIMDDGLQNYGIKKDVSIAVIDGMMGFGNGRVIPAGPLRQPLHEGFDLADAFILIGEDSRGVLNLLPQNKPVFGARLDIQQGFSLPENVAYVAFSGIGFPDKFRATLEKSGAKLTGWHAFADHHAYSMKEIESLVNEALEKKSRLITTEKDYARLPDFAKKTLIDTLPVEITFDDPEQICRFIAARISRKQKS